MDEEELIAAAHNNIEDAINEFINVTGDEPGFSTGWVLISSVSTADNSRYISLTSEGLPYHAQLGLLVMAKREIENYGDMNAVIGMFDEDDE